MAVLLVGAGKVPIGCCLNIVRTIIDCISVAQENDELCGKIVRRAEVLKGILEQLQAQTTSASSTTDTALYDLQKSLEKCEKYMESLDKRKLAQVQHYARSQNCNRTLQSLDEEVNAGVGILTLALSARNLMAQLDQRRDSEKAQQEALNPQAGVYAYTCKKDAQTLPYAEAVANNDTNEFYLVIGWRYTRSRDRTAYEVQYDEENQRSVTVDPDKTGVKLGKPKIYPGRLYYIRMREIMSSEARKWSDTIPVVMPCGPPNVRPKFSIHTNSISKATIAITRPTPEQENGSPVTAAIVEIRSEPNLRTTTQEIAIQPGPEPAITAEIAIEPNTTSFIRVRVKNAAGVSDLSTDVKLNPSDMAPGPPTSLSVVARAENKIKIAWEEPSINPTAVKKYQIEKRRRSKPWEPVGLPQPSDKLSAVVADLETNKKYWFRVFAINDREIKGESCEIQSETKCGPKTRGLLTGLSAVGGTLGGVLLTPVGIVAAPVYGAKGVYKGVKEKNKETAVDGSIVIAATPLMPVLFPAATAYAAGEAVNKKFAPDEISDDDD